MSIRHPSLGQLLFEWRTKAGLLQGQAAERAGVNQGTWSRWETGDSMPGADQLRRILEATGGYLTASELVEAAVRKAG